MSERKSFPSISPAAYEHPADRAALSAFLNALEETLKEGAA